MGVHFCLLWLGLHFTKNNMEASNPVQLFEHQNNVIEDVVLTGTSIVIIRNSLKQSSTDLCSKHFKFIPQQSCFQQHQTSSPKLEKIQYSKVKYKPFLLGYSLSKNYDQGTELFDELHFFTDAIHSSHFNPVLHNQEQKTMAGVHFSHLSSNKSRYNHSKIPPQHNPGFAFTEATLLVDTIT